MKKNDEHPIQISTAFNEVMKRFDVAIFAGNFKTKDEAAAYAKRIVDFLEAEADGKFQAVQ